MQHPLSTMEVHVAGPDGSVLTAAAPRLTLDRVRELARERWGMAVTHARFLPSERDLNVMLDEQVVLKISNPAERHDIVEMETMASERMAALATGLRVPRTKPSTLGNLIETVVDDKGRECFARLITRVSGSPLEGQLITSDVAEHVGALSARATLALQGLFHPAAGRDLDWDVRRAADVVRSGPTVEDVERGWRLDSLVPRFEVAAGIVDELPAGLQHGDVTLTNVLVDRGEVDGLIDFGDMHHTAAICDLAVTLTSVLRNTATEQPLGMWDLVDRVLRGYQRHRLLSMAEVAVLGELVLARLAITLVVSARRRVTHADNTTYITQYDASTMRVIGELLTMSPTELADRFSRLAGTAHGGPVITSESLPRRRSAAMGGGLSPLFYRSPLEIVRGAGPWLFARDGRRYLDAYNNVPVLGHAHPAVTRAVSLQLATLNTHSRYLHPAVVELAERLLRTVPAELDTCLFTTSGTEANDLAWRMAAAYTGASGAVVAEHAYHGSSAWFADLSSNEWPPGYAPAHVATFAAPRPSVAGLSEDEAAARVDLAARSLSEGGDALALVLADTAFTSEGVWDVPPDFLKGLVTGAHRNGGLYLADEVQSGYHRTGEHLWRFSAADVVPDLVTLGKPMGAGYPIGAVLTRRDIADALARDYEYFSTFAATPAAAVAGLTVLDHLELTGIPHQVSEVGDHLRAGLSALASPHIAAVRGRGLMVGIQLLPPPGLTGRAFTRGVLDRLAERQVLAGTAGPDGDVLKVRPPLIWQPGHADLFVEVLGSVLNMGDI